MAVAPVIKRLRLYHGLDAAGQTEVVRLILTASGAAASYRGLLLERLKFAPCSVLAFYNDNAHKDLLTEEQAFDVTDDDPVYFAVRTEERTPLGTRNTNVAETALSSLTFARPRGLARGSNHENPEERLLAKEEQRKLKEKIPELFTLPKPSTGEAECLHASEAYL